MPPEKPLRRERGGRWTGADGDREGEEIEFEGGGGRLVAREREDYGRRRRRRRKEGAEGYGPGRTKVTKKERKKRRKEGEKGRTGPNRRGKKK